MFERLCPGYVGVAVMPVVAVIVEVRICHVVAELAVADGSRLLAKVYAGLIECHRIKRSKHSDIGKDRRIILAMAVTVRRYVSNEADMESRSARYNSGRIFSHSAA